MSERRQQSKSADHIRAALAVDPACAPLFDNSTRKYEDVRWSDECGVACSGGKGIYTAYTKADACNQIGKKDESQQEQRDKSTRTPGDCK